MNNWRIKTRVLFAVLIPLTITILALSVHTTWSRLKSIHEVFHDRGQEIVDQIAPAVEYGILLRNQRVLANLAQAVLADPDVTRITVYTRNGEILSSTNKQKQSDAKHKLSTSAIHTHQFQAAVYSPEGEINGYHSYLSPRITNTNNGERKPKSIGSVVVSLSDERMISTQNTIVNENVTIALAALLIAILLSLKLSESVARPIQALVRSVIEIKNGNFSARIANKSGGELGILEKGINTMADSMAEARLLERRQAEDVLYLEKLRAQITLESLGEGVISTDSYGNITYINPAAERMTGWTHTSASGQPLSKIFTVHDQTEKQAIDYPLFRCIRDGETIRHESDMYLMRQDGSEFSIQDVASPIRDRHGTVIGAVIIFRDYTEIHNMAQLLEYQATHDDLTGLLNRREFERCLTDIIESGNGEYENILFYLDLDQFKIVNDTFGHFVGDKLLKNVSRTISNRIRADDIFARLGGDEFGLILIDCTLSKGLEIAESIRSSIKGFVFQWKENMFEVGVSIGVVPLKNSTGNLTNIMSTADSACYVAKDKGRNRIHVYQHDDKDLTQRRGEMLWVNRLHKALTENRFHLYAQPIIHSNINGSQHHNSNPAYYEILLRMTNEEGNIIGPSAFIPPAERYQIIGQIDRWVIHSTFEFIETKLSSFNTDTGGAFHFNINLSGQSVCDESFLRYVIGRFDITKIDPTMITFEITETAAIANLSHAIQFMDAMKERGCLFALDDFGSGLSSFRYLSILPVDYIKIDGYFIRDIETNAYSKAMVEAVNNIGHVLGIKTIAEFVENAEIQAILRECGVDMVQGFHLGRPLPLSEALTR